MAAFHPEQFYAAFNIGNLQNVPLSQIASRYGPGFADYVQGYYTEHPTARFQAITGAYAAQQNNIVTAGGSYAARGELALTPITGPETFTGRAAVYRDEWLRSELGVGAPNNEQVYRERLADRLGYGAFSSAMALMGVPVASRAEFGERFIQEQERAALPSSATFYVPYGHRTQQELLDAKAIIDTVSGRAGFYQVPKSAYEVEGGFHRIYGWETAGGSTGALQSGMFSVGKPLTPDVRTQWAPGNYAASADVVAAQMIRFNPSAYSRLGAEEYGGTVTLLDGRQLAQGTQMGRYEPSTGNLANLVDPYGVNRPKSELISVEPWKIDWATSPALQTMKGSGFEGTTVSPLTPSEYAKVGMAPQAAIPTEQASQATGLPKPFISVSSAAEVPTTAPQIGSIPEKVFGMLTRIPSVVFGEKRESYMPLTVGMIAGGPTTKIEEVGFTAAAPVIERIPLTTGAPVAFREILPYGQEVPGAAGPAAAKSLGAFWQEGAQIVKGAPKTLESAVYGQGVPGAVSEATAKQLGAFVPEKIYQMGAPLALVLTGAQAATVKAPATPAAAELPKPFVSTYTPATSAPTGLIESAAAGYGNLNEQLKNALGLKNLPTPSTEQIKSTGPYLATVPGATPVGMALQTPGLSDYAAEYLKGEIIGIKEQPLAIAASFGAGLILGGAMKVAEGGIGFGRATFAEKIISEGGVYRAGERLATAALDYGPTILGGIYAIDVGSRVTKGGTDFSQASAGRAGQIMATEVRPMTFGGITGYKAPGDLYRAAKLSDIGYKSALQEGEVGSRFEYYTPVPRTIERAKLEIPQFIEEAGGSTIGGLSQYAQYKVGRAYRTGIEIPVKAAIQEAPGKITALGEKVAMPFVQARVLAQPTLEAGLGRASIEFARYRYATNQPIAEAVYGKYFEAKTSLPVKAEQALISTEIGAWKFIQEAKTPAITIKSAIQERGGLGIDTTNFIRPSAEIARINQMQQAFRPTSPAELPAGTEVKRSTLNVFGRESQRVTPAAKTEPIVEVKGKGGATSILEARELPRGVSEVVSASVSETRLPVYPAGPSLAQQQKYRIEEEELIYRLPPGMVSPGPKRETVQEIFAMPESAVGRVAGFISPTAQIATGDMLSRQVGEQIAKTDNTYARASFQLPWQTITPATTPVTTPSIIPSLAPMTAPTVIPTVMPTTMPITSSIITQITPPMTSTIVTPKTIVPEYPAPLIPKTPTIPPAFPPLAGGLLGGGGGLGGGRKRTRRFMEILPLGLDIGGWGRAIRGRRPGKAVKKKAAPAKGKSGRKKKR